MLSLKRNYKDLNTNNNYNNIMGRMNIYFDEEEDKKLDRLKIKFSINSKEDVIKRLIKKFPEPKEDDFDLTKETGMDIGGDII